MCACLDVCQLCNRMPILAVGGCANVDFCANRYCCGKHWFLICIYTNIIHRSISYSLVQSNLNRTSRTRGTQKGSIAPWVVPRMGDITATYGFVRVVWRRGARGHAWFCVATERMWAVTCHTKVSVVSLFSVLHCFSQVITSRLQHVRIAIRVEHVRTEKELNTATPNKHACT